MDSINLYSLRTLLAALTLIVPARRWLTETFFGVIETHETDTIDIDIVAGGMRMAPFVHPNSPGKTKQKQGYNTHTYKIPYVKELFNVTAHEMLKRLPGESVYSTNMSPGERAIKKIAMEMTDSYNAIDRRVEWMCAQILNTGKVICRGEGLDETVDFLLPSDHSVTLTNTALWSAPTTAKPLDNLKTMKRLMTKKGKTLTDIVMGIDAYDYFMACDQVSGTAAGKPGMFNMNRINVGSIDPTSMPGGVTYVGRLTELGVDVWTYEEYYVDDQLDVTTKLPIIDPKKVIGIDRFARRTLHYGAIKDLDCTAVVPKFPKVWKENNPSAMLGSMQSAPLPAAHDIEGIYVLKVLS